jgi:hypothetical protein
MDDGVAVEFVEIGEKLALSSALEASRMWGEHRSAILEKKPSARLSQEPCFGVNTKEKRPSG